MKVNDTHSDSQVVGGRSLTRRDMLTSAAAVVGGSSVLAGLPAAAQGQTERVVKKGRIKQAICGGCLRKARMSMEETASLLV